MIEQQALISLQDFVDMVAQAFFQGNTDIAGIVIYSAVLGFAFMVFARNNILAGTLISLPLTLIFSLLGILPALFTLLMIVITILILANEYRNSM